MDNEIKLIFHIYLSLLKKKKSFFSPIEYRRFYKRLANARKGQFILIWFYQWLFSVKQKMKGWPRGIILYWMC